MPTRPCSYNPSRGCLYAGVLCARLCAGTGLPFRAADLWSPSDVLVVSVVVVYFFFLMDLTSPKNGLLQGGRSFKQFIRDNKMELTPIIRRPLIRLYIIECSTEVHGLDFE